MFVFQTLGRSHGKGAILLKSLYLHYFLGELHGVSLRLASRRDGHGCPCGTRTTHVSFHSIAVEIHPW